MPSSNKRRKLSYITSIVFIFVVIFSSVTGLTTEDVYAATNAFSQIEAENYSSLNGTGIKTISINGGSGLGYINSGEYAVYNSVDFGNGTTMFKAKVATSNNNINIQIKIGSPTSNSIGTLSVPSTGGWDTYKELTCSINNISGINNLYLVFSGSVNIDWFVFTPLSSPTPTPTPIVTAKPTPTTTLSSEVRFEAEDFNSGSEKLYIFPAASGSAVGEIENGYYMEFTNINLGTGITSFKTYAATNADTPTSIEIRTGSKSGPLLGTLTVASTGGWDTYKEISCSVSGASGINNIYLIFSGPVNVDWFSFMLVAPLTPAPTPTPAATPTPVITPTPVATPTATYNSLVKFEAESRNEATSSIKSYSGATGTIMGNIAKGDYMAYYGKELGLGVSSFKVYAATTKATTIEIRIESIYGPLLGTLNVASTGSFDTYQEMSCSVSGASGRNNVYLVFNGPVNLDWCSFTLTSSSSSISAFSKIEAENYSSTYGSVAKAKLATGGYGLAYIESTDLAIYNNLNFENGAVLFKAYVATSASANIEIRIGGPYGTLIGNLSVPSTGSFDTFKELSCSVSSIKNINNICLVFSKPLNIDWFTFVEKQSPTNTPTPSPTATPTIRSAFTYLQAESYNAAHSDYIQSLGISNGVAIGYISDGDSILFNNIDFGGGASSFKARVATESATSIEIRVGSSTGTLMGTLNVASTGSWDTYNEISYTFTDTIRDTIKNVQDLYFVFKGPVNLDWFIFTPKNSTATIIDAYSKIEAENFNNVSAENIKKLDLSSLGRKVIGSIQTGNFIVFNKVNFGNEGAISFKATASNSSGSTTDIQIRLGSSTGTIVGTLSIPSTSSWDEYNQLECNISRITNVQDLYLVFTGPTNFDWFTFSKSAAITPTPTPTPTPTVPPTPTPTPTPIKLDEPNFNLLRNSSVSMEIGSNKTITEVQKGTFDLNGLGTLKADKELVLLVDNSNSDYFINTTASTPLDFAIFSNNNLIAIGDSVDVIGDINVNNTLETHVSQIRQTGTSYASAYKIDYGCSITGNKEILDSPITMPSFHSEIISTITDPNLIFTPDPNDDGTDKPFPGQPSFNIRYDKGNNLYTITCGSSDRTFELKSSMYFHGNLQISVPHISNTDSCFIVADGYVKLEGHNVNSEVESDNTTNVLNIYSIHGKIWVATETSKIYGVLYAEGDTTNPLYPYDNGIILMQGINTEIYGSVVAGGGVLSQGGGNSKYIYYPGISSQVESKYMETTVTVTIKDLAKKVIDKFAGSNTKVGALQYSDSANINSFELYDISTAEKAAQFKTNVIDAFPITTSNQNNLGDALRRARYLLSDPTKSSPDADKYIVVLAASAPNKWTSNDDISPSQKHTEGDAVYLYGDGTIDTDGSAFNYAIASAEKVKEAGIKTVFIDSSLTDISANIEEIAKAAGATAVEDERHYYTKDSLSNLSVISKTVSTGAPIKAVLKDAEYKQTFPVGIILKEIPAGWKTDILTQPDGSIRYMLSGKFDVGLDYNGTGYYVQEYSISYKVFASRLGNIKFEGSDSKIIYTVDFIDAYGNAKATTFEKSFDDLYLNVIMSIDIG